MLAELLKNQNSSSNVSTGIIEENMLNGYYKVIINGITHIAFNQTGSGLENGITVTVSNTNWGRFITAAQNKTVSNIPKIMIRG